MVNNMKSFSMHQNKHLETVTCKFSEPNDKSQHSMNSYEIKPLNEILLPVKNIINLLFQKILKDAVI